LTHKRMKSRGFDIDLTPRYFTTASIVKLKNNARSGRLVGGRRFQEEHTMPTLKVIIGGRDPLD
jgi:hypothetical protein